MIDEMLVNQVPEQVEYPDYTPIRDNAAVSEVAGYNEFEQVEETTDTEGIHSDQRMDQAKKNRALASMSTGVVSAIAAAAVGITSMLNVSMTANFNKVEYVDGQIAYEVSVTDMTEKETLTAYVYEGDELVESINLVDEDGDGIITGYIDLDNEKINSEIENGAEKVSYRVSLNGVVGLDVERKFDSYLVEIQKMTSSFEALTGECHCGIDGCYHFTMDFTDDLGIFDNFNAKIEDAFGNTANCTFTDDLHEEQTIFVGNLKGSNGTLTLTYTANGEPKTVKIDITM